MPAAEGLVALVTGGARRLGAKLVRALAEDGYRVAFSYHESEEQAHQLVDDLGDMDLAAAAYQADLRKESECDALLESVVADLGSIGLLVNNAGLIENADADSADVDHFDRAISLNLRAPYLLSFAVARAMQQGSGGAIVNIASLGGLRPYKNHIPYSVSKAGVIMLTRSLALAFAPSVTVNAVAPGTISLPSDNAAEAKAPLASIPLGSYAAAADVEEAVLYLASAPHITGQILSVDGGAGLGSIPS
jgi:pteridine reductase